MEAVIGADLPEFVRIANEIASKCDEVGNLVNSLREKVDSSEVNRQNGLGFLELKHNLMLSYVVNLVQVLLIKVEGQSLMDHQVLWRLTELRTVMEKIRPIDHKLRYQVDKLIRTATTASANDPLHFRPRPSELVSKLRDNQRDNEGTASSDSDFDAGQDEDTGKWSQQQLYVPPRVVAVPYDNDKEEGQRSKRKRSQSSVLQELKDELSDAPLELKTSEVGLRREIDMEEERERERFEEDQMNRIAKKRMKKSGRGTSASLDRVTDFSGLETLLDEDEGLGRPSKRRKPQKKKKGTKRRFKQRK